MHLSGSPFEDSPSPQFMFEYFRQCFLSYPWHDVITCVQKYASFLFCHECDNIFISSSIQAEALVKAQQDIGETMGELGLAFIKLTKFETEEAVYNSQRIRVADIRRVATAAVKASRFYRESNAHTVKHLVIISLAKVLTVPHGPMFLGL